jgi:hypothetical protein
MSDRGVWRQLLPIAVIVFIGVLIEVSLIYFSKLRGGNLGFSVSVRPSGELF